MRRVDRLHVFLTIVALGVAAASMVAWAEDAPDASGSVTIRKSKEGLNFTLPPDWPIEKRGGIMAPIPIEEYLGRKFSTLESRLKLLEQQANGLDVRLRIVEEGLKRQQRQGLTSTESSSTTP